MSTDVTPIEAATIGAAVPQLRQGRPGKRAADGAFRVALLVSLGIGIASLVTLLVYVTIQGWPRLGLGLITDFPSRLFPARAGARSAFLGTLWVMALCILFTVPIGIGAAVYLEEYANTRRWYNRLIEINIQNLAAVPSIVFGILGLAFVARGPLSLGPVILSGGIILSLLVLPIVIIASREAIRAVPSSIRDGAFALGATRWQTVRRQILPAAIPGIATSIILGLSRAIGEAAPLLLIGAVTFISFDPEGLDSRFTVMPVQIFNWTSQSQEEFKILAAAASVLLLVMLLAMNALAIIIRNRYQRKW